MNPGSSSSLRPRVAAAAALLVVWGAAAGPALAQDSVVTRRASDARMKGAADAPITVFELADFECPFCRRVSDEVLQLLGRG
jgi:protein-disulfide isomerase